LEKVWGGGGEKGGGTCPFFHLVHLKKNQVPRVPLSPLSTHAKEKKKTPHEKRQDRCRYRRKNMEAKESVERRGSRHSQESEASRLPLYAAAAKKKRDQRSRTSSSRSETKRGEGSSRSGSPKRKEKSFPMEKTGAIKAKPLPLPKGGDGERPALARKKRDSREQFRGGPVQKKRKKKCVTRKKEENTLIRHLQPLPEREKKREEKRYRSGPCRCKWGKGKKRFVVQEKKRPHSREKKKDQKESLSRRGLGSEKKGGRRRNACRPRGQPTLRKGTSHLRENKERKKNMLRRAVKKKQSAQRMGEGWIFPNFERLT